MKRVLVIAYHFPPLGTGGVGRALGWARHLKRFAWLPSVLAAQPHPGWPSDESLVSQIPDDVDVTRVSAWDPRPARMRGLEQRELTFLWRPAALRAGRKILRQNAFDLILSTAPPPVAHAVAAQLGKEFNVPWIADFRDPWALREPTLWRRTRRKQLVSTAAAVVAVNHRLREHLETTLNTEAHTVFNGYEPDEMPVNVDLVARRVVLLGTLSDFNDFQALFRVVAALKGEFVHIGAARRFDLSARAAEAGLNQATSTGYLPRIAALHESARGSVMVMSLAEEEALTLPTKMFDYIGLGRPVLCLGDQGAAAEFMRTVPGLGVAVPAHDGNAIERALLKLWSEPMRIDRQRQLDFTRAAQIAKLSKVMDAVS